MPTAQATQAAEGPLRAGASLSTKLVLELPHPAAHKAASRQGCGVGVGSRPQPFVDKQPGKLKADRHNRGQRTKIANERDSDGGIAIISKPLPTLQRNPELRRISGVVLKSPPRTHGPPMELRVAAILSSSSRLTGAVGPTTS